MVTSPQGKSFVHVAVGVVLDAQQRILIALRASDAHQGGLWEFPGGKVEAGEEVGQALTRELAEELGITAVSSRPLIQIEHDYSDKKVLLDVHWVEGFDGVAEGREGQPIRWVTAQQLAQYAFPAANQPIITAVQTALLMDATKS